MTQRYFTRHSLYKQCSFILCAAAVLLAVSLYPAQTAHAQNSLDLNDLDGTNGYTMIDAGYPGGLDQPIASGDFNGDGIDDLLFGAKGFEITYLVFGKSGSHYSAQFSTTNLNGTKGYRFLGVDSDDENGKEVAAADVNNDGIDDLIINDSFADPDTTADAGTTYIIFGDELSTIDNADGSTDGDIQLSNVSQSTGYQIHGIYDGDNTGSAISTSDLDNDGYDDVLIGSRKATVDGASYAGEAYLLYGNQLAALDGDDGNSDGIIKLENVSGSFGYVFRGASDNAQAAADMTIADMDNDGLDDLVFGARLQDADGNSDAGITYVVLGDQLSSADAADGSSDQVIMLKHLDGTTGYKFKGIDANDWSGTSVYHADVNGDGIDDLLMLATGTDTQSLAQMGEITVAFGGQLATADAADNTVDGEIDLNELDGSLGFTIRGTQDFGDFGGGIDGDAIAAGDINRDGVDDIVISNSTAVRYGDNNRGETYVIFGRDNSSFPDLFSPDTLNYQEGFGMIGGSSSDDYSGGGVGVADLDDDGFDDVIVTSPNSQDGGKAYVFSYPVLQQQITGGEGFRLMSAPVSGKLYDHMLADFWTQGFTGADAGDSYDKNAWIWLETLDTDGDWNGLTDLTVNQLYPGQGFLFYLYSDDNADGSDEGFPKTLTTLDLFGDLDISDNTTLNSGSINPFSSLDDGRYYLTGNPYWKTINWDAASGWTKNNLSNTIYVWDESANSGNGSWLTWNGTTGSKPDSGMIAPFEGFFVQAQGGSGSLSMTEEVMTDTVTTLSKETPNNTPAKLILSLSTGQGNDQAFFQFDQQASMGADPLDARQLEPLSDRYVQLYSTPSGKQSFEINALPSDKKRYNLPLYMTEGQVQSGQTTDSEAILSCRSLQTVPDHWTVTLVDTETGTTYDLRQRDSIRVELDQITRAKQSSASDELDLKTTSTEAASSGRYELQIQTGTPSAITTNQQPKRVQLHQNYPNPFNPTTTIRYDVPAKSNVSLSVYNMLGRKVTTLVNQELRSAGRYKATFNATGLDLSSGLYIYKLTVGDKVMTRKMTLVK